MPLSRYEIRNEYSLADPELYKSADRDDPEALLEGVAMAGLVGVLRQLGDLAEFAAEVFHNLHEEVMETAERGHSLKARVQQLEVEFPLIEKAYLSQTNHSDFFYTAGVDWHPNMHIDQNYITRGDLPRFIMDSYEEARGPPQLFLLDKFDVAGAGACLKRFTDPSFFKVEAASLGITNADVQQDKVRKGKRRGSRWRNGETPEVLSTPHAKLHELLLEERIENTASNPVRRVKLKRRLNGFPFDLKTGKSYMEKILRTPPDYREFHEVRNSSPLKLLDNDFIPELEMDNFGSGSPDVELTRRPIMSPDLKNGLQNGSMREMEFETFNESNHLMPDFEGDKIGLKSSDLQLTRRSPSLNPDIRGSVPNISMDEQEFEAFGIERKDFPEGKNNLEVGNVMSTLYEDVVEKHIMVDKESKSEGSSVYQSDGVASEVENYMDALAAMESEMETDSELRAKGNLHVLSKKKMIAGLDAATPLRQAHFSDSQSMGSSTLSDDGNSSSKKYTNSSYSSSPRILAKKALLEDEVSDEIDSSNENGEAKRISRPLKWRGRTRSAGGNKVAAIPPYKTDDVDQSISITDISPGFMVNRDAGASEGENGVLPLKLGMLYAEGVRIAEPSNATENESIVILNASSDSTSSSRPQKTELDYSFQVVTENYSSSNGDDSHLAESSSSKPITSDDICCTGESKDQHMGESVVKNMYLLQDVTSVSCSLDGGPLNFQEDLCSSHQYQPHSEPANDNPSMPEHPTKPSPLEQSENGLNEDLPNDESGRREVIGVFNISSVHPSSCKDDIAEEKMSRSSVESMPQAGDGQHDFDAYPVNQIDSQITTMSLAEEQTKEPRLPSMPQVGDGEHEFEVYSVDKQIDSQMTTMSSAEEQTMEPRLPELETENRTIDAESTDDSLVREVSPPKEVAVEEVPTFSFQRDISSENFHISGMTNILQPLDPVNRSINNPIEEQFLDTSLSKEYYSDGADHNVKIPGGRTMALPGGESAVDMEDQALSGVPKCANSKDVEALVVLDSVPRPDVESSDNGDDILHELPSLAVRVVTDVTSAGETSLFSESPSVKPEIFVSSEKDSSVTADDMPLLNAEKVETSSYQMENLHGLSRLVAEELGGVASSTDVGERGTTHCDFSAGSVNLSDADVEGGRIESNLYGVDVEVPFSVMYGDLDPEERENFKKAASQPLDYDHSDSRIIDKISNSHSESESSLQTDITASSTFEQNGSHINGVLAEQNTLDAYRVDTEKRLYTQDASLSMYHVVDEQKVESSLPQLDNENNPVYTVADEPNVVLEPQLTQKMNSEFLNQEGISGIASISFPRNLPGQHSGLELFPQEKPIIDDVGQHNKPLGSLSPAFSLLPDVVNTDPVEMPPLPPLPPVQWRMGKKQQASLAHELAVIPNNNIMFPSMAPSLSDLNAQTPKLILPSRANAAGNSLFIPESISDTSDQDHPSSLQVSLTANITHLEALGEIQPMKLPFPGSDSNRLSFSELQSLNNNLPLPETCPDFAAPNKSKFPSLSETESMYQYLPLPAKLDEMPSPDDHTSTSSNASTSGTNGNEAAACDVELVVDSATLSHSNNTQETNQNKILDQGSSSSESNASTHDASARLTGIDSEGPHNMMLSLEGEVAWPAQDEGKPYGVRPMKPPRQRNPLIDAVIALDRSKFRKVTEQPKTYIQKADERDSLLESLQLRKVTEQPRAQILKTDERDSVLENLQLRKVTEQPKTQIQKADERDSLLEQIRARTVNLKPTVVSRPASQGPSTNLKVAAILEKAKTIRQAFAGSDDDDDDDSWSDS